MIWVYFRFCYIFEESLLISQKLALLVLLLFAASIEVDAQEDSTSTNIFLLSLEELMDQQVSIATKSNLKVKQAPAVITVITREEIENLPVRNLGEILQMVPGFEITPRVSTFDGVGFRGVKDNRNTSRFLLLLDGFPFNKIFRGNSIEGNYTRIDINSIERIEIIRGPGSALYGRNAFLAVINIITRSANRKETVYSKLETGSFNSYTAHASFGKKLNENNKFFIAATFQNSDVTDTKTYDEYNQLKLWNQASHNIFLHTSATFGDFGFNASGSLSEAGTSLNNSYLDQNFVHYSLNYNRRLTNLINFKCALFGHNSKVVENFEKVEAGDETIIIPATDSTPAIALKDIYPDGIYYTPYYSEYIYGSEIETEFLFSEKNQLLLGTQYNFYGVYNVKMKSNINLRTGQYYPGYTRSNLPMDTLGWFENGRHSYTNLALYAQDIWYPVSTLGITIGGRFDIDSEIGAVFNPRFGLTWLINKQYNLKLLYGQAYRAPSPTEQYQTLGYAFGNTDLKSEKIKTFELAFQQNLDRYNNQINIYYNIIEDMIYAETQISVDPNNTYYNLGTNKSFGIEIESRQKIFDWFYSFINYSYNVSTNTKTIDDVKKEFAHVDVAPHKINAGINILLPYNFGLSSTFMYRSKMEKFKFLNTDTGLEEEVSQDTVGNYTVINAKLIYDNANFPLGGFFSVYNLLDTEYYSQDNELRHYPPMPGIHFIAGITLQL